MAMAEQTQMLLKEGSKSEEKEKKVYIRIVRNYGHDWYELDLEEVEAQAERGAVQIEINNPIPILETAIYPSSTHRASTSVAVDSKTFYVFGGRCWGYCNKLLPLSCAHVFADVFRFDINANANNKGKGGEWRKLDTSPMNVCRLRPTVFAHQDKIYVFGGGYRKGRLGEVFDPNKNAWTFLTDPPPLRDSFVSHHSMVLDSSRHRILVSTSRSRSLYAYDLLQDTWSCLDSNFGRSYARGKAMVMDDVLYCVCQGTNNNFLYAYDLVNSKWLTIDWSSKPTLSAVGIFDPDWNAILPLDRVNGKMCLAFFSSYLLPNKRKWEMILHFAKLTVQRVSVDKLLFAADAPILSFRIDGGGLIEEFITLND